MIFELGSGLIYICSGISMVICQPNSGRVVDWMTVRICLVSDVSCYFQLTYHAGQPHSKADVLLIWECHIKGT